MILIRLLAPLALCTAVAGADVALEPLVRGLATAREHALKGAYDDAARALTEIEGPVAQSGRAAIIAQWRSWTEQAQALTEQARRLATPRPEGQLLLERAILVTLELGDTAAGRFLLAKQEASTEQDACQPISAIDTTRLIRLVRWYDGWKPASATGAIHLRWAQHAALTELQDRARCGDVAAAGFDAKADAVAAAAEQGDIPLPLAGPLVALDLVDGDLSAWDPTSDGLRNRGGQRLLPFALLPDGSYTLRVRMRAEAGKPVQINLPLPGQRICSLILGESGDIETSTATGIGRVRAPTLARSGEDIDLVCRVLRTAKGMRIAWRQRDAEGAHEWLAASPVGEVDSRPAGIAVQGDATIAECRLIRLGGTGFAARGARPAATAPAAPAVNGWQAETGAAYNPCTIMDSRGAPLVQAQGGAGGSKAVAMLRNPALQAGQRTIGLTLSNPGDEPVFVSLAVISQEWHETVVVTVPARGQYTLRGDLRASTWRTSGSMHRPTAAFDGKPVTAIALLIHNSSRNASIRIDRTTFAP